MLHSLFSRVVDQFDPTSRQHLDQCSTEVFDVDTHFPFIKIDGLIDWVHRNRRLYFVPPQGSSSTNHPTQKLLRDLPLCWTGRMLDAAQNSLVALLGQLIQTLN